MSKIEQIVPGYVTVAATAEYLGITDSLVNRYIRIGRLPAVFHGRRRTLLSLDAVREFKKIPRVPGPKPAAN